MKRCLQLLYAQCNSSHYTWSTYMKDHSMCHLHTHLFSSSAAIKKYIYNEYGPQPKLKSDKTSLHINRRGAHLLWSTDRSSEQATTYDSSKSYVNHAANKQLWTFLFIKKQKIVRAWNAQMDKSHCHSTKCFDSNPGGIIMVYSWQELNLRIYIDCDEERKKSRKIHKSGRVTHTVCNNIYQQTYRVQGNTGLEVGKVKPNKPLRDQSTTIHTYIANGIVPCAIQLTTL